MRSGPFKGAATHWLLWLLLFASFSSTVSAQAEPIEVGVRIHLLDLNAVDTETETFSVNGDLYLTWPAEERPATWEPEVHFINAQELHVFYRNQRLQERDGRQYRVQKTAFQARFNSQFEFSQFPFDTSRLKIYLRPSQETGELRLSATDFTLDPLAFDSQWNIETLTAEDVTLEEEHPEASQRLKFSFGIARLWGYHVWYYFLPLILITATPWSVFWYRPPNPQVPVVSMLGLVAYNMVFAQHLPQLGHLTLADAFFLHCLVGIFISTVGCAAVLNASSDPQREKRLLRFFRWVIPLAQVVSGVALFVLW